MKSTERFSSRVENYRKYRPGYPKDLVRLMFNAGVSASSRVADIGAGTGIFTQLLLEHFQRVDAVEPNAEMRAVSQDDLSHFPGFHAVDGTAENTTLGANSVDAVTVAQAFHWFDAKACHREFSRILRPGAPVVLVWNARLNEGSFLQAYENLLNEKSADYREVNHRNIDDDQLSTFFTGGFTHHALANEQVFDLDGFLGRVFSSSYTPSEGSEGYDEFHQRLVAMFHDHQKDDRVAFLYQTDVYIGCL